MNDAVATIEQLDKILARPDLTEAERTTLRTAIFLLDDLVRGQKALDRLYRGSSVQIRMN